MTKRGKIDVARQNVIGLMAECDDDNVVLQEELEDIEHRLCLVGQIIKQDKQLDE